MADRPFIDTLFATIAHVAGASPTPNVVRVLNFPPTDPATYEWSIAAFVVSVVTLIAVLRQIWLATDALNLARTELAAVQEQGKLMMSQDARSERQAELATEQTRLARTQAEIVQAQLARRSTLSFGFSMEPGPFRPKAAHQINGLDFTLEFLAHNSGDRPSRDFYITVLIPTGIKEMGAQSYAGNIASQGFREEDGTLFQVYQNTVPGPLLSKRWLKVGKLRMIAPAGEYVCYWHLSDEDGEHPGSEYGKSTVVLEAPSP